MKQISKESFETYEAARVAFDAEKDRVRKEKLETRVRIRRRKSLNRFDVIVLAKTASE